MINEKPNKRLSEPASEEILQKMALIAIRGVVREFYSGWGNSEITLKCIERIDILASGSLNTPTTVELEVKEGLTPSDVESAVKDGLNKRRRDSFG